MGAEGIRVEQPGDIAGAVEKAFASGKPCVVEVMTEITAVAPAAYLSQQDQ